MILVLLLTLHYIICQSLIDYEEPDDIVEFIQGRPFMIDKFYVHTQSAEMSFGKYNINRQIKIPIITLVSYYENTRLDECVFVLYRIDVKTISKDKTGDLVQDTLELNWSVGDDVELSCGTFYDGEIELYEAQVRSFMTDVPDMKKGDCLGFYICDNKIGFYIDLLDESGEFGEDNWNLIGEIEVNQKFSCAFKSKLLFF